MAWNLGLGAWGDVSRRKGSTLAEKEIFQVLDQDLLVLPVGGIQPVFVQDHLAVLAPHLPGFFRDVFINPPTQFRIERRLVQSWHIPLELHAKNLMLPWPLRFRQRWR